MNILKKIVTSDITGLSFAIGAAALYLIDENANKYFIYGSATLLILSLSIFLISHIVSRIELRVNYQFPAVYISVEHDWQLSEQGDFHAQSVYTIKNIGNDPISVLPLDDLAWSEELEQREFKLRVHESEKTYKIVAYRLRDDSSLAGTSNETTKYISWSNMVEPPLKKGKSIKYVIEISTPKTEVKAFTKEGTYAGIPANLPTYFAKLNYVAPKGYIFELIEPLLVVDAKGTVFPDDANGVNYPQLTATKSILQWELENLKTGRRYWFKYRLVKND
jgi:hypothetical protein